MAALELKGGERLQKKLADIARKLASGGTLRVGFLEGATYPDGTSVATIAAIQNFGASNIPARPFFTDMIARKSPEWGAILMHLLKQNDHDVEKSLRVLGEVIAGQLRQSIVDTNAPPLSPVTVKMKGFAKPLVDTGHMLASVDYEVTAGDIVITGNFRPEGISDDLWAAAQAERQASMRAEAIK